MGVEKAFTHYAKQMRDTGALPLLCQQRQQLIEATLLDLQVI